MKEILRAFDPRAWAALAMGLALLVLVLFAAGRCSRSDEIKAERGRAAQAEGRTVSAAEAIQQIDRLEARGDATDNDVKEAHDAIRQETDPAARDRVARARLCRLQHRADCDRLQ